MKTHLDVDHDGEGSDADIGDGQEEEEEVLLLWSNRQVRIRYQSLHSHGILFLLPSILFDIH